MIWLKHLLFNKRLDEQALREAMNIRNKKETKSMLVDTIHTWGEELRSEGEKKKALKTAQNLLSMNNLTVEQIARATELSLDEVRKLQSPPQLQTAP